MSKTKLPIKGEYYADYDADTESYCVFNINTDGFAYASLMSPEEAERNANERNN